MPDAVGGGQELCRCGDFEILQVFSSLPLLLTFRSWLLNKNAFNLVKSYSLICHAW